ncbi:hypothetical protein QUB32_25605 [Microcoleus sp. AT8-A4]|uniref:Uncharacterized protein n=1 Tax=Microcoleus asticus IPMA8 TaxID=2563858 RepID=A0ABX2D3B5_9CYAN|nr:hypothetical protein [Microcoleus asticus]NQE37136.1 hypothetical protein [Microcoleus asticus IPMA8]
MQLKGVCDVNESVFHTRSPQERGWSNNEKRELARIPIVGEYVATAIYSPWFCVQLVVHTHFDGEFDAKVYAVAADHNEVLEIARAN